MSNTKEKKLIGKNKINHIQRINLNHIETPDGDFFPSYLNNKTESTNNNKQKEHEKNRQKPY